MLFESLKTSSLICCVQKLQDHLARFSGQYDQLVAFKPTGWTFSQQVESVEDIQPQTSGNISIYGALKHTLALSKNLNYCSLRSRRLLRTLGVGSDRCELQHDWYCELLIIVSFCPLHHICNKYISLLLCYLQLSTEGPRSTCFSVMFFIFSSLYVNLAEAN